MRKLISLGQDCDVAFQLRMHGEENIAHFFDWLLTPVDGIIQILNADFDVFYPDHLDLDTSSTPHHVVDRVTNVRFFHQFPFYNGNVLPNFLMFYDSFIARFRVLADRFRSYVMSGPVTLVRRGIAETEALALEDAFFRRFPGADAKFLYINEHGRPFVTPHGSGRNIAADGTLGDPIAWWATLQDEGLLGLAFRHATVEVLQHDSQDQNLSVVDRLTEVQLQTAAAVHADHGKFPLELARFYARRQRWDKAEEMARLALERSPGLTNAAFELNYINWKAKKITSDEAASTFLLFLETQTHDPSWLMETCAALLEAGRIEEAVAYSDKAVMAAPRDSEAHYHRAICFMRQNRFDRANYAITTALGLREHAYMRHVHATILGELRRWDEAIAEAKLACKLDGGIFYINHLASLLLRATKQPATPQESLVVTLSLPDVVNAAAAATPTHIEPSPILTAAEDLAAPEEWVTETTPAPEGSSAPAEQSVPTIHQLVTSIREGEGSEGTDEDTLMSLVATAALPEDEALLEDEALPVPQESTTPLKFSVVTDQPVREEAAAPIRVLAPLRA